MIEPLEPRIAPASAFVTYTDVDGDLVKITATKSGTAAPPLDDGDLTFTDFDPDGQLARLNLTDAGFQGASITFTVTKKADGDGFAHVGHLDATGRDLGTVVVKGDLGVITAGDTTTATGFGVKSLSVRTFGVLGTSTGGPTNADNTLESRITGKLGTLKVAGDFGGAWLRVMGNGAGDAASGIVGSVTIGRSQVGGFTKFAGSIESSGDMGAVKIGRDLVGGPVAETGKIDAGGKLTSLSIRGSLIGGGGNFDTVPLHLGQVFATGAIGTVSISGSVLGGAGIGSGAVRTGTSMDTFKLGGSLVGGSAGFAGEISGFMSLRVAMIGGDIVGGEESQAGFLTATTLGSVTVKGSVVGGTGRFAGAIFAGGSLAGPVKIGGDLIGGSGDIGTDTNTGTVGGNTRVGDVTIGGSVVGGSVNGTGRISGFELGAIKIGGNLVGGSISGSTPTLSFTGEIHSSSRIKSVTIGGSVIAGFDSSTGGDLIHNAAIHADDDIGAIVVRGSLIGNFGNGIIGNDTPVIIAARGQDTLAPGATTDLAIKSVSIGGRVTLAKILAGFDTGDPDNAGSNGNASIGPVKVGGDWVVSSISAGVNAGNLGFSGGGDAVINNPPGAATDGIVARIASIAIRGDIVGAPSPFFQTGFVAQQIGSFKAAGFTAKLTSGTDGPILLTFHTANVNLREV